MFVFNSCKEAIKYCIETKTFSIAHMYKTEKTMNMHVHDCYEVYFSISGGKQFLIGDTFYSIESGDMFLINQYESHCVSQIDQELHERIVLSIYPDYIKKFSTEQTDLNYCFSYRNGNCGRKISLSVEDQKKILYFIHELSWANGLGKEILECAVFLEMMVFLNKLFLQKYGRKEESTEPASKSHDKIMDVLSYINQHLSSDLSIKSLAEKFYLSQSYLSMIFKNETGTTINKYITAQRITLAKSLLSQGNSVTEVCSMCGYEDYSNFLRAFTKTVGISPKKYAQLSR